MPTLDEIRAKVVDDLARKAKELKGVAKWVGNIPIDLLNLTPAGLMYQLLAEKPGIERFEPSTIEEAKAMRELDAASMLPGPVGLGHYTNPTTGVRKLRGIAARLAESAKEPLLNPVAVESNRVFGLRGPARFPERIFYHGGPPGLEYLESPGVPAGRLVDPNISLGTHFGPAEEVSRTFWSRYYPQTESYGSLYLAKLKASRPIVYKNEQDLIQDLLLMGTKTGDTQDAVRKLLNTIRGSYDEYGNFTGAPIGSYYKGDPSTVLTNVLSKEKPSTIMFHIEPEARDRLGTMLLRKLLSKGYDAIIYGNEAEGWRFNPSVIVPFREQIELVDEIPSSRMEDYLSSRRPLWRRPMQFLHSNVSRITAEDAARILGAPLAEDVITRKALEDIFRRTPYKKKLPRYIDTAEGTTQAISVGK